MGPTAGRKKQLPLTACYVMITVAYILEARATGSERKYRNEYYYWS